jgi:hypothetical protein
MRQGHHVVYQNLPDVHGRIDHLRQICDPTSSCGTMQALQESLEPTWHPWSCLSIRHDDIKQFIPSSSSGSVSLAEAKTTKNQDRDNP